MRIRAGERLDPAVWDLLAGEEEDPFDAAALGLHWREKDEHVVLEDDGGRPVAAAGLVMAEITAGGERVTVAGIGGVIVAREHRGRGHARAVVRAVLERAGELGAGHAVLFCLADRRGLYARLGFTEVPGPVRVDQPGGSRTIPMHTMRLALRPGEQWPAGPVEVPGLPF